MPFENLDIHLGRLLSLAAADLFTKIVTRKRGGYCYDVNGAFALLLQALGFQVQGLLARVLYGTVTLRPRSHQLSLVTVEDEAWIADVGFGRNSLRAPVRLTPDMVEQQGPDIFRLRNKAGQTFTLQKLLEGHWQDLYAFTLEPFLPVDYLPFNYWNSTSPDSQFTQRKICTMPTATGRIVAVDTEFKIRTQETPTRSKRGLLRSTSNYSVSILAWRLRAPFSEEDEDNNPLSPRTHLTRTERIIADRLQRPLGTSVVPS